MSSRSRSASTSEPPADRRPWTALLGAAALAASVLVACVAREQPVERRLEPTPPKVPTGQVPRPAAPPMIRAEPAFDHAAHLGRGPECLDCHKGAETADDAGMPTRETCMECHEEIEAEAPPEKRIESFLDPKTKEPRWNRFTRQKDEIKFSHVRHVTAKVPCADCHASIAASKRVGPEVFLSMDDCMACHTKRAASNDCKVCHTQIGLDRKPASHTADFEVRHGPIVRSGAPIRSRLDDCAMCHKQESCAKCHQERAPKDHTPEWRTGPGHGAAAGTNTQRCATCHVAETCTSCHAVTMPHDHTQRWRQGPGHGQSATTDRERCAMCHEDTKCLSCHRMEPPRDHTQNWRVGPGHALAASLDRDRCAPCHTTDQCVACHSENAPRSHRAGWGSPRNRHCITCHEGPGGLSESGCATCHRGTPSHRLAPDKPDWHRPDFECLRCHSPRDMRHPVNDQNCNVCHR